MTEPIHHLARRAVWEAATAEGVYTQSTIDRTLAEEGYIHASSRDQVRRTADRYYRDRDDIVLLVIDPTLVDAEVVFENTSGGTELFPHIYGPLPAAAVTEVVPLPLGDDGRLVLPEGF